VTTDIANEWYWDRRNRKSHFPVHRDDDVVGFVTFWSTDELADATEGDVFVPLREARADYVTSDEVGFDYFDSFRLPDEVVEAMREKISESDE